MTKPPGKEEWIPIELFDDKTLEDHPPREWLSKAKNVLGSDMKAVAGKGLHKERDFTWKKVYVYDFISEKGKFVGFWAHDGIPVELSRLDICFEVSMVLKLFNSGRKKMLKSSLKGYNKQ